MPPTSTTVKTVAVKGPATPTAKYRIKAWGSFESPLITAPEKKKVGTGGTGNQKLYVIAWIKSPKKHTVRKIQYDRKSGANEGQPLDPAEPFTNEFLSAGTEEKFGIKFGKDGKFVKQGDFVLFGPVQPKSKKKFVVSGPTKKTHDPYITYGRGLSQRSFDLEFRWFLM